MGNIVQGDGRVAVTLYRHRTGRHSLDHKKNSGQLVEIRPLEKKCQHSRVNSLRQLKSGMCS